MVQVGPENITIAKMDTLRTGPSISGTLQPRDAATINAEVAGSVLESYVDRGERVKRGQLLLRIDDLTERQSFLSAQSAARSASLAQQNAESDLKRDTRLYDAGAIAERDLEATRRALASARAASTDAQARLATAQQQLEKTRVASPLAGIVSDRPVNAGDVVQPGTPLVTVIDPSSMRLEAAVPSGSSVDAPTGWALVVPAAPTSFVALPDLSLVGSAAPFEAFQSLGALAAALLIFTILLSIFFDAMGTMVGLSQQAGLVGRNGQIQNVDKILLVDAAGAIAGGAGSVSSNQIFVESSTGIADGARTGLANVVTGVLFLLAMFITPLVNVVPFEAVAPAMVVVGFLMAKQVVRIEWDDWGLSVPSFLTFAVMPFTYSIADGIGAGFVSYVFIRLVQGRGKEVHPLMYVVAAAFVVFFGKGVVEGWMA